MTTADESDPVIEMLLDQGFRAPRDRPSAGRVLRPDEELIRRLMVVKATAAWVAVPEERVSSALIQDAVARLAGGGRDADVWFGAREKTMLATPRGPASTVYRGSVGWGFEGAWALAWVLGYEEGPDLYGTMMPDDRVNDVLQDFLPPLEADVDAWLAARDPDRFDDAAVAVFADAFAHVDASARGDAVPAWFSPAIHGRIVMERHRALAWALRPGTRWDAVYAGG
ncbi:MAG: DUF4272 domain-containing protein [Myxococcota bacterium]